MKLSKSAAPRDFLLENFILENLWTEEAYEHRTETYLGHCQTSMMEFFDENIHQIKTVNYIPQKALL